MSEQRKTRSRNTPTILLDDAENQQFFSIIPKGSVSLAAGVVQLFLAEQPSPKKWNKRFCGVACFVKDNTRRSYYISVFDVENRTRVWEQELYQGFRYKTPREYFHTFETDKGQAALNFASEDEAFKFKETVEAKLAERHKRKIEKKRKTQMLIEGSQSPMSGRSLPPIPSNVDSQGSVQKEPASRSLSSSSQKDAKINSKDSKKQKQKEKEKDKKKKKISKLDIGAPEDDFRIVSHVGWDPNKGFSMTELDPDMQTLLKQVGITETGNVDKATFDFIYDFVEQSGGIEQLKKEMREMPTTPGPPTPVKPSFPQAPPPQIVHQTSQGAQENQGKRPPPPPARNNNTHLSSDQSSTLPPPPVPSRPTSGVRRDLPPTPQPLAKPSQKAMPPPPASKPPSRMRSGGNTPPLPPAEHGSDFIDDLPPPPPELMEDINQSPRSPATRTVSTKIKKTPPATPPKRMSSSSAPPPPSAPAPPPVPAPPPAPAPPPPMPAAPTAPPPPPSGGAGRGNLLNQIQSGTKLNKVSTNENRPSPGGDRGNLLDQIKQGATLKKVEQEERPAVTQPTTGIAGALFKALNDRQKAIQGSDDDSDSDEDFDDDEWDED